MGDIDDSEAQQTLARGIGVPFHAISEVEFLTAFAMLSLFIPKNNLVRILGGSGSLLTFGDAPLDTDAQLFAATWEAAGWDRIVFAKGGHLFSKYPNRASRLRQLRAVSNLRERGLTDLDLLDIVSRDQELTYVAEALAAGVSREYATA